MAPKQSVERTRLEDILDAAPPQTRRPNQSARKSTGGKPPRKLLAEDRLSTSASPDPVRKNPSQCARKSTGGKPPKPPIDSSSMPFRAGSTQSSSSSSSSPRIMQTMDGATSRSHSSESAGIPLLVPPLPDISTIPVVPCGLCPVPLRTPYTAIAPSDLIHSLMTICQHSFHHICYMNYITTAPADTRAFCPKCQANILTKERFWVHATTHTGNECYTDMTDDIEQQILALRTARQQILIDMLSYRNFQIAAPLLVGPEAVDVNYRSTKGGFTPLHVCAVQNDVEAIDLLLSHGADKYLKSDDGLMAIDYATSNNAWDAAKRLE